MYMYIFMNAAHCSTIVCTLLRDQTAQTTTAQFIPYFINFKDFMYLYIHTFYHISYFNNFLLIIYKLM
jgi:hypothetical protein